MTTIDDPLTDNERIFLRNPEISFKHAEILTRCSHFAYIRSHAELVTKLRSFAYVESRLENSPTHLNQVFVAWDNEGTVVVSFAGSNQKEDWRKNAKAFGANPDDLAGRHHNGFRDIYEEERQFIREILEDKITTQSQLWICGHSLGGAMATALSAELMKDLPANIFPSWGVFTIGAPRYGNEDFVSAYDAIKMRNHWYFVNQGDIVPRLPPKWLGYRHEGMLHYFNKNGQYQALDKSRTGLQDADPATREAFTNLEALDQLVNSASTTREEYEAFLESEEFDPIWQEKEPLPTPDGGLEGERLWLVKNHSRVLYWERIRSLL